MKGGGIGGAKVNVIKIRLMKQSYLRVVHIILAERTLDVCRQDLHQSELMVTQYHYIIMLVLVTVLQITVKY